MGPHFLGYVLGAHGAVPAQVTGLALTVPSSTGLNLSWNALAPAPDTYRVERGTDGVSFAEIGSTAGAVTTYADTGLTYGTTYYYRVRARDGNGDGPYSSTVSLAPTVLARATFYTKAKGSNGALTDGKGAHAIQHGSAAGADANDPLWLPWTQNYVYFPGTAGNSLTVPNAGTVSTSYTITYDDNTTATNTSATNPLTFGDTDVQFAGKKVKSIVFTGGLTGSFLASGAAEPFATYSDGTNTWTFNRTASGRKLALVDRDLYLFGVDDYLEVASAADLNMALTDSFTIAVAFRCYTNSVRMVLMSKAASAATNGQGWTLHHDNNRVLCAISDGTNNPLTVTPALTSFPIGFQRLEALIRDVGADTLTGASDSTLGTPGSDTTTATLGNSTVLRIGSYPTSVATLFEGEFLGAAVFKGEALASADLTRLKAELLA